MIKYISIFLLGLFLFACSTILQKENGGSVHIVFDWNGDTLSIKNYNNQNELEGESKLFNSNNKLKEVYNYKNGIKEGVYIIYLNGIKYDKGYYTNGKRSGWRDVYWPNGKKEQCAFYSYDSNKNISEVKELIKFDTLGNLNYNKSKFLKVGLLKNSTLDSIRIRIQLYNKVVAKNHVATMTVRKNNQESYAMSFTNYKKDLLIINKGKGDSLLLWGQIEDENYYEDYKELYETGFFLKSHEISPFEDVYPKTPFEPVEKFDTIAIYDY